MTEDEIIKGLENCGGVGECQKCPLNDLGEGISVCISHLSQSAVELIHIQRNSINALHGQVRHQRAEIERLQKENHQFADIGKLYSEIKSDVAKEFAEQIISYLEAYIVIENTRKEKELYKFIKDTAEEWE